MKRIAGQPWQVLIVEDDPAVAAVYKRAIATTSNLEAAGVVSRGEDALMLIARRPIDLMLLDLNLDGMNGLTLLQRLRSAVSSIEVIAMTARADSRTVRAIVQRGALDYLVKPFTVERLRQALARFLVRANALRPDVLDQDAVDRACGAGRRSQRWLPKGLTSEGLASVIESLSSHPGPASANDVAEITGLSRVTARRYLEYMVATVQASVEAPPAGPGRPRKLYQRLSSEPAVHSGEPGEAEGFER